MNLNAEQTMSAAEKKREAKAKQKTSLREKFFRWEEDVFKNELQLKFPDMFSFQETNQQYMLLFHNPDFQFLRHPKFWNTEKCTLTEKQRQRNRSRSNSISRVEDVYSMQGSEDSDSSFFKNQKHTKSYISKKKKAQLQQEMQQALTELKNKRE